MAADTSNKGLIYFTLDVGELNSDEILLLEEAIGECAIGRYLRLRDSIHAEGYFLKWNDITSRLFCKRKNYKLEDITELIRKCCLFGLFSLEMYEWYGILTSIPIQTNYVAVAYRRERPRIIYDYIVIPKEKWENDKMKKFTYYNRNDEKLDYAKLLPISRPKKKVNTIDTGNLFTPIEELEIINITPRDFSGAIDEYIEHVSKNGSVELEPQKNDYLFKPYTFNDAMKDAKIPYEDKEPGYKETFTKQQHNGYLDFLEDILHAFPQIMISENQVSPAQLFSIMDDLKPKQPQIQQALFQICKLGHVKPNSNMAFVIRSYIEYAIEDDKKKNKLSNKNPNNVPRLN